MCVNVDDGVKGKGERKRESNYLSVKANSAGERFPRISRDIHVLARPYLTDVVREVDSVTFVSSQSE